MNSTARTREIAKVERLLVRLHSPRLQMMLIVALTGAVGFLASFGLLHAGVKWLWLRYPLAVTIAYLALLFFLWCWVRLRSRAFIDALDVPHPGSSDSQAVAENFEPGGGNFGGGGASASFDDASEAASVVGDVSTPSSGAESAISDAAAGFDLEELGVVLLGIGALIAAAMAAFWIVWVAPALFAELILDALLASGLYRRLKRIEEGHWLATAIRWTIWPFVGVAVLFSLVGVGLQIYAPEATSMGQVIRTYQDAR